MPAAEAVHGIRFIMFTDTKWKKSHSTCPGCKDAAMQVSHQRRRHNPNSRWPEYRQQFNSGAPALNSLISSDVSAHATRIGFHKRGGKGVRLPEAMHTCRGDALNFRYSSHACDSGLVEFELRFSAAGLNRCSAGHPVGTRRQSAPTSLHVPIREELPHENCSRSG